MPSLCLADDEAEFEEFKFRRVQQVLAEVPAVPSQLPNPPSFLKKNETPRRIQHNKMKAQREVEEKFGEQNFRVFSEMRGQNLYVDSKNGNIWVEMG